MNLKNYLTGLFVGHSADGELDQVKEAAKQDARLMVGTYVSAFEAEAAKILTNCQLHFLGHETEEDVVDGEFTPVSYDWGEYTRPELMRAAKERGLTLSRKSTKKQLVEVLERSET